MPFYAHPTALLSPGDVFPRLPFSITTAPLRVARLSGWNPPAGREPAEFRKIFTLPQDAQRLSNLRIETQQREDTLASTRVTMGMLLTWGSQIEADQVRVETQGRVGKLAWLAAPIYRLLDVPADVREQDPETHMLVPLRDLVRGGKCRDYFYLPPFPNRSAEGDHYVELRKITPVGMQFFVDSRAERIATLTEQSLGDLFTTMMWSLTRAELFFRPVTCPRCAEQVPIDVRFHGQNFDAEPWE